MMSLTFGLFTQVSGSGPLGPLVNKYRYICLSMVKGSISICLFTFRVYSWKEHAGTGRNTLLMSRSQRFSLILYLW